MNKPKTILEQFGHERLAAVLPTSTWLPWLPHVLAERARRQQGSLPGLKIAGVGSIGRSMAVHTSMTMNFHSLRLVDSDDLN
jgi:hypothetical protein